MKNILTLRDTDISTNDKASELKDSDYHIRHATRAVVINDKGQIPVVDEGILEHHKMPGGGVEPGEDIIKALYREVMEEVGCEIEVIGEIGEIDEYRDENKRHQISYCYLVRQVGEQQNPSFTQSEIDAGFKIHWVDNIDEAIQYLIDNKPSDFESNFIYKREMAILTEAKKILDKK